MSTGGIRWGFEFKLNKEAASAASLFLGALNVLKFPAKLMSPLLEDTLKQISLTRDATLWMPILADYGGAYGGDILALQTIASWASLVHESKTLRLDAAFADAENSRDRFASTLPGMAALYFSDHVESGQKKLSRYQALEFVAPRVAAMKAESYGNTMRGQGVLLCCFAGAKSEFLTALYSSPRAGAVRSAPDFHVLVSRILEQLSSRISNSLNEGQLDYLSELIHQLFLNADEHGAYDASGNRIDSGMRGILIRYGTLSTHGIRGADSPLQNYLHKQSLNDRDNSSTRIAQISIFDTGPGMALRWLSERNGIQTYDNISLSDEIEAVKTCFLKHATTKSGQFSGQGLPMALSAMKRLGAFMTLRTGRISLYQDLSRGDTVEFSPIDRFPNEDLNLIAGTAYSIYFRVS